MSNCPNCGAPIEGGRCAYCGTSFDQVASMAIGNVVDVSFEYGGVMYEFSLRLDHVDLRDVSDYTTFYDCSGPVFGVNLDPDYRASFEGKLVPKVRHGRECLWLERTLSPEEMTV